MSEPAVPDNVEQALPSDPDKVIDSAALLGLGQHRKQRPPPVEIDATTPTVALPPGWVARDSDPRITSPEPRITSSDPGGNT